MRIVLILAAAIVLQFTFSACGSDAPKTFCDTVCFRDTLKFEDLNQPHQPYVYISAKDCKLDKLIMSHSEMSTNRVLDWADISGDANLNKDKMDVFLKDSSYAWFTFNDCLTGQGYIIQVPFDAKAKIRRKPSAFTSFDPKYNIAPGLNAYTDKGNIFVEDMATGKTAMMTFGQNLKLDYANMHEFIDSVNITPTHVWSRVKIGKDWVVREKTIELKAP